MPPGALLPEPGGLARWCRIEEAPAKQPPAAEAAAEASARRLFGEVRALGPVELAAALEAVLRALAVAASRTEAVLEVGATRAAAPQVASVRALEELARDISAAGFGVRFGPSWSPAPVSDVCVGVGGDSALQDLLTSHPSWTTA